MGFIHNSLDAKLLALYLMSRVATPISFDALVDLAMRCESVDYFLFAQEVAALVKNGHLTLDDGGLYAITEKGRTNVGVMEDTIPTPIRRKANEGLSALNTELRRNAQVTAKLVDDGEGRSHVELGLCDDAGTLFSLFLTTPSKELGEKIVARYHEAPEDCFNAMLTLLLQEPKEDPS